MHMSQKAVAKIVDELGRNREKANAINDRNKVLVLALKRIGGGDGGRYVASLVRMPRKVMVVKAHTQVRTTRRLRGRQQVGG